MAIQYHKLKQLALDAAAHQMLQKHLLKELLQRHKERQFKLENLLNLRQEHKERDAPTRGEALTLYQAE